MLTLEGVARSDSGAYVCVVTSACGAVEGDGGAPGLARRLTAFARDAGGADNITVAAVPFD